MHVGPGFRLRRLRRSGEGLASGLFVFNDNRSDQALGFTVKFFSRSLKYRKISSFDIFDNFLLKRSRCSRMNLTASNVFSVLFIFNAR